MRVWYNIVVRPADPGLIIGPGQIAQKCGWVHFVAGRCAEMLDFGGISCGRRQWCDNLAVEILCYLKYFVIQLGYYWATFVPIR